MKEPFCCSECKAVFSVDTAVVWQTRPVCVNCREDQMKERKKITIDEHGHTESGGLILGPKALIAMREVLRWTGDPANRYIELESWSQTLRRALLEENGLEFEEYT
jgi:hypothetical protein